MHIAKKNVIIMSFFLRNTFSWDENASKLSHGKSHPFVCITPIIFSFPAFFSMSMLLQLFSPIKKSSVAMNRHEQLIVFLIIFSIFQNTLSNSNDAKEKITSALMEKLNIHHRILVDQPGSEINVKIFKNELFWNRGTVYQDSNEFVKYIKKTKYYPDPKTLIVFKNLKLSAVSQILKALMKLKYKMRTVAKFTWLIFADSLKSLEKDKNSFLVPHNCEFLVAYPVNSVSYKLVEIYKIKSTTATNDFAFWNGKNLEITKVPWYRRRHDFKNETLVMFGIMETGPAYYCMTPRVCAYLEFVNTISSAMNFNYKWVKFANAIEFVMKKDKIEIDFADFPADPLLYRGRVEDSMDVTGQAFNTRMNWYIREPERDVVADYYILPFDTELWIFTLTSIVLVSLVPSVSHYLLKKLIDENQKFSIRDYIFMPLDCFTNQEGTDILPKTSSRILCFFTRFLVLFLFGAYLATFTSFFSVHIPRVPFRNMEEFLKNGKYKLILPYVYVDAYSGKTKDPTTLALSEKHEFYVNETELAYKLCNENVAAVLPDNDIYSEKKFKFPCKFYEIEQPLVKTWSLIVVKKNSQYVKIFNLFLGIFHSSGIRHRINEKFIPKVYEEKASDYNPMEFEQIVQILGIFVFGAIFSAMIFIYEITVKCLDGKNFKIRRKIKRGEKIQWRQDWTP